MGMKLLVASTAIALAAAAVAGPAAAAGFYVQEQSVRGLGRAYSGEAADTGAASLWWNPAAIGGTPGHGELYAGAQHIKVDADITDKGSTIQRPTLPALPVGGVGTAHNPIDKGTVPNLAAAWTLNDQWAVGLALSAPFNFTTRYPLNSFTRYQALKSSLVNFDVQPTLAWRPTPEVTVGVGVDAVYTRASLSSAYPNLSPLLPDGASILKGNGWNPGFVGGVQWRPSDSLTLGASFRTAVRHKLKGRVQVLGLLGPAAAANVDAPAQARFETPAMGTFSARWKVAPQLTLNAQVQSIGWSVFDVIQVSFAGRGQDLAQNYHDTTTIAVGADYEVTPQLTLRAGVQRDPTPTPDVGRTARVPDGDRWLYGAGATWRPTPQAAIDVGVAYIHFADSLINSGLTDYAGTPLSTPVNLVAAGSGKGLVLSAGLRLGL